MRYRAVAFAAVLLLVACAALAQHPGGGYWIRQPVANQAALPATGNTAGDVMLTMDTGGIWRWTGSAWTRVDTLAPTATALAAAPTTCVTGSHAQGVLASGNATGCGVVPIFLGVGNTASRPATCTAASSTAVSSYLDTQVPALCLCTATNTWKCSTLS